MPPAPTCRPPSSIPRQPPSPVSSQSSSPLHAAAPPRRRWDGGNGTRGSVRHRTFARVRETLLWTRCASESAASCVWRPALRRDEGGPRRAPLGEDSTRAALVMGRGGFRSRPPVTLSRHGLNNAVGPTPAFGSGRATVRHGLRPTDRPRRAGGSSLREPPPATSGAVRSTGFARGWSVGRGRRCTRHSNRTLPRRGREHHRCHVGHHDLGPSTLESRNATTGGDRVGRGPRRGLGRQTTIGRFKTGSDSLATSLRTALTWNAWSHTAARRETDRLVASTPCAMDRTVSCKLLQGVGLSR